MLAQYRERERSVSLVHSFEEPLIMQRQELVMRALTEALRVQMQVDLPQPEGDAPADGVIGIPQPAVDGAPPATSGSHGHQGARQPRGGRQMEGGRAPDGLQGQTGVQLALVVGASLVNLIEGEQGNIGEPDGNREHGRSAERPPRRQ